MARVLLPVFLVITAGSLTMRDSDGYYCVGPDYIAYQFGMAPPSTRDHRLHIARLGGRDVISPPDTVRLPQFQVHGLVCEDQTVEVASWDAAYTVALPNDRNPKPEIKVSAYEELGEIPGRFRVRMLNLGMGARPGRIDVLTDDNGIEYALEVEPETPLTETCVADAVTRLVAFDTTGQQLAELIVYEGAIYRACGH